MNRFITFEGIEGSGKSTQVGRAAAFLTSRRVPHVVTREPGGTRLGDAIRRILLHPDSREMVPMTELLLIGAARAQHLAEVVLPALQQERVVLCDRFEDSTRAYQGDGRGLPPGVVQQVCTLSAGTLEPGLTFLFDLPAEDGLRRARRRNASPDGPMEEGRFDAEALAFHRRVRDGLLARARGCPERIRVLPATEPAEAVALRVAEALGAHLGLA